MRFPMQTFGMSMSASQLENGDGTLQSKPVTETKYAGSDTEPSQWN